MSRSVSQSAQRAPAATAFVAVLALLLAAGCSREPAALAPPPPLAELTQLSAENAAAFGQAFDEGVDRPRLLLLLSPT